MIKLLFRKGFFFTLDRETPGNSTTSSGTTTQNPPPQQNQNQPPAIPDPFEGLDMDMLDPVVRDKIVSARATFATVANQANQARAFQSRYDQTVAQLNNIQQQISRGELAPRTQTSPPQTPSTLVGDLERYYIEEGIAPEQAKSFARLNAGAMEKFGSRFSGQLRESFSPIAQQVVNQNAATVFEDVMGNDRLGINQIPEVAQMLWERTQQMAAEGQLVNLEVAQNLARIYWAKHMEENGSGNTPTTPVISPPNIVNNPAFNPPNNNQQTRFTYPGAGAHVRPQAQPRNQSPMDADTQAALSATVDHWTVKPQAFRKK